MRSERVDNLRNLSRAGTFAAGLVQCKTMRMRLAILALALVVLTPSVALADATVFLGRNSADDDRSVVRGFAFGVSLLVCRVRIRYGNTSADVTRGVPSLKTTSGNVYRRRSATRSVVPGDRRRRSIASVSEPIRPPTFC